MKQKTAFNHPACLLSPTQASLFIHHQGHVGYRWFWARALNHTSRHGRVRTWSIHTHNSWQFTEWETYYTPKQNVIPHSRRNLYWSLSWGAVGMPPALLITVYMVKPRHPRSLAQFFLPPCIPLAPSAAALQCPGTHRCWFYPEIMGMEHMDMGSLKIWELILASNLRNHNQ